MSFEGSIYISSIALSVDQKSCKTVDHFVLQTRSGGFKVGIPGQLSHGQEHKEVFNTPLELSAQDELCVSMQCQTRPCGIERTHYIPITMKRSDIMRESRCDAHGKRTHMKLYRNILVTMDISCDSAAAEAAHVNERSRIPITGSFPDNLFPTTSEILPVCPRFRLLIVGNTGVGKSSIIRNVFEVQDVPVSESSRGKPEIDREFVTAGNGLFVLHDSPALDGAEDNLAKVKNFIHDRRQKQDLEDRLHAVWVCLQVPYTEGRLLGAGMEGFLRNRKEILGDIPIVVVLTKLDLLDNTLMWTMRTEGVVFNSTEEAKSLLAPRRAKYINEHCTPLLVRAAGSDVPHVAISTMGGYGLELTISELVKKTTSEIERYIRADASYGVISEQLRIKRNVPLYWAGIVPQASVEVKVDLTIEIGKRRHWANLGASSIFSRESVKEHLFVIHRDIIEVWNFHDPEMALQDEKFKEALWDSSEAVSGRDQSGPYMTIDYRWTPATVSRTDASNLGAYTFPSGHAILEPVAPTVSTLRRLIINRTMVVVTLPVAGVLTVTSVCSRICKSARTTAKRFMAYIADLIYVMKILFILAPHGSVTARNVALAFDVYKKSTYRNYVHLEIKNFSAATVMLLGGHNAVVEKIEVLIRRCEITDEDVSRLRSQIPVPPAVSQKASAGPLAGIARGDELEANI